MLTVITVTVTIIFVMDKPSERELTDLTPWTVEELIVRAERIMSSAPDLFDHEDRANTKELNVRLIRDYVVREFIPRPVRTGREARFGRDHLVHLLAVRALLRSQKWSLPAIKASFVNSGTDELLNGVLAQVRARIESEYRKATRIAESRATTAKENLRTPTLNPAQLLIEKFKGPKPLQSESVQPLFFAATPMACAAFPDADVMDQRTSESRTKLHFQLEPWCEVVIDAQRMPSLTSEGIEFLGEALKRLLRKKTAR